MTFGFQHRLINNEGIKGAAVTQAEMVDCMRSALSKIACHGLSDKPKLSRRQMQDEARKALRACGYDFAAQPLTGRADVVEKGRRMAKRKYDFA